MNPDVWLTPLEGDARREAAYRLHLLGLTGGHPEVMPGYLRTEEQLRRAAKVKLPHRPAWTSVTEALGAPSVDRSDWPWFERRLALGEGQEAAGLAAAAVALMPDWRPPRVAETETGPRGMFLVTSPAVRPMPAFGDLAGCPVVAAGPQTSPELIVLGATARCLTEPLRASLADLPPTTAAFCALMAAGTAFLARAPTSDKVDAMLRIVVRDVLPPQHRAEEVHAHIQRLAPRLDQPPGEIERTMHGLGRNRADRLHRAWLRGFFVPRGVALERPARSPQELPDDA
jgi:hypothetical protein